MGQNHWYMVQIDALSDFYPLAISVLTDLDPDEVIDPECIRKDIRHYLDDVVKEIVQGSAFLAERIGVDPTKIDEIRKDIEGFFELSIAKGNMITNIAVVNMRGTLLIQVEPPKRPTLSAERW